MFHKNLFTMLIIFLFFFVNNVFTQWQEQDPGYPEDAHVLFSYPVNDSVVWAVGGYQTDTPGSGYQGFSITTDGGESWYTDTIEMAGLSDYKFTSIFAISDSVAWVSMVDYISSNHQGRILKTTDGGNSWQHQSTAYPFHPTLAHIPAFVHFFDENHGICAGHFGEMYYTSNGGDLWTQVPDNDYPSLIENEKPLHSNVSSVGDSIAWYGTSSGRVFKTTNKGVTWSAYDVGLGESYLFAFFKDELNGLATAPLISKNIAKTTDGGETWETLPDTLPVNAILIYVKGTENTYMYGSSFLPTTIGSASGSGFTEDDGNTWLFQESMNLDPMLSVKTDTGWIGWATAPWSNNKVYKRKSLIVDDISSIEFNNPTGFELSQNYPNPFNPVTAIGYQLSAISNVELSIYNLLGQKIATLVSEKQQAGYYQIQWDASGFASGIYLYMLVTDNGFIETKKLILLK